MSIIQAIPSPSSSWSHLTTHKKIAQLSTYQKALLAVRLHALSYQGSIRHYRIHVQPFYNKYIRTRSGWMTFQTPQRGVNSQWQLCCTSSRVQLKRDRSLSPSCRLVTCNLNILNHFLLFGEAGASPLSDSSISFFSFPWSGNIESGWVFEVWRIWGIKKAEISI